MAAYKGVSEYCAANGIAFDIPAGGLRVVVTGTVPLGSGLSSSAALVCASALALLGAAGVEASKKVRMMVGVVKKIKVDDKKTKPTHPVFSFHTQDVATFCAKCEKYVGTESGGMDQAASILGRAGSALRVSFAPTGTTAVPVPLPPSAGFVVAHTLAESKKAETAAYHYNLRVVECRLAAAVLGVGLGLGPRDAAKLTTLRDVEPFAVAKFGGDGVTTTQACLAAVEALLKAEPYSQADVEDAIGITVPDLLDHNATQLKSVAVAPEKGGFHLRSRARHVYSEAARVGEFADVCARAAEGDGAAAAAELGALMDLSQASCRDDYDCSCPELDALVAAAKKAGAIGARLTGAGWGGCTVSLVPAGREDAFIEVVTEAYYKPLVDAGKVAPGRVADAIFATRPAAGGAILRL